MRPRIAPPISRTPPRARRPLGLGRGGIAAGSSSIPAAGRVGGWNSGVRIARKHRYGHCQSKVAGLSYSTEDRGLGLPELTPLGKCSGAVELEIIP